MQKEERFNSFYEAYCDDFFDSLEEKEIYFKGGMDEYFYFKRLGILR